MPVSKVEAGFAVSTDCPFEVPKAKQTHCSPAPRVLEFGIAAKSSTASIISFSCALPYTDA